MRATILFILSTCLFFLSCQRDKFEAAPDLVLEFSTDTIVFDTVFVTAGSITKRVKIYNPGNQNVIIEEISLSGVELNGKSNYRLNINGAATNKLNNIELPAEDSIYVFAEVTIDPNADLLPFVVRDSILFRMGNGKDQKVYLEAFGRNATFFNNEILDCNSTWDNTLPIVIYNSVLLERNCQLTIKEGTQIYFNSGSFLFIDGTLKVEGTADNPVEFQGDRLDEFYRDLGGTWGGLHFLRESRNSVVDYAIIKNGLIGIRVDSLSNNTSPKLELSNSVITNHVVVGLLGYTGSIKAYNNLITDCGRFAVAGLLGGDWDLKHNTVGNFSFNFSRNDPSVIISNADLFDEDDNFIRSNDLSADVSNNIFWGDREEEVAVDNSGRGGFNVSLKNNLIRTRELAFWDNSNKINLDPKFKDPLEGDYSIDTLSIAFKGGLYFAPLNFPELEFDLIGQKRLDPPTIGAIERLE